MAAERTNSAIHTGTTNATDIGPGRDLAIIGIYIPSDLVGTLTLAGLLNVAGAATNLVIPAATQGNVFSFLDGTVGLTFTPKLTATLSNANDVVLFVWSEEG